MIVVNIVESRHKAVYRQTDGLIRSLCAYWIRYSNYRDTPSPQGVFPYQRLNDCSQYCESYRADTNPSTDRRTDRPTDKVKSIYPHPSPKLHCAGGINMNMITDSLHLNTIKSVDKLKCGWTYIYWYMDAYFWLSKGTLHHMIIMIIFSEWNYAMEHVSLTGKLAN